VHSYFSFLLMELNPIPSVGKANVDEIVVDNVWDFYKQKETTVETTNHYALNLRTRSSIKLGHADLSSQDECVVNSNDIGDVGDDEKAAKSYQSGVAYSLVYWFDMVLFGGGIYPIVPIIWAVMSAFPFFFSLVVSRAAHSEDVTPFQHDLAVAEQLTDFLVFISTCLCLRFGYAMHRDNYIVHSIEENCMTGLAKEGSMKVFSWLTTSFSCGFFVYFIFLAVIGLSFTKPFDEISSALIRAHMGTGWALAFDVKVIWRYCSIYIFFSLNAYLTLVWMWLCWVKFNVNISIVDSITQETIINESFIKVFCEHFFVMSKMCEYWSTSNISRFVVVVPVAWYYRFISEYLLDANATLGILLFILGYTLFLLVLFTVAFGGFVNDHVLKKCLMKISYMVYKSEPSLSVENNELRRILFKSCRFQVEQRIITIHSVFGLTLAGVPLSTGKAIALVSIILAITRIKLF